MCGVGSRATTVNAGAATAQVRAARDFLLNHREDYATAYRDYRSLVLKEFNWALDWFDAIAWTRGSAGVVDCRGQALLLSGAQLDRADSSCSVTRSSCGRRSWPR